MDAALSREKPTALVTGGSRGIGRAICLALARDGFQIILTYRNRAEDALATLDEIRKLGSQGAAFALDASDSQAIAAFFAAEIKDKVNLFVLVNNAGITADGLLLRMKDEQFEKVINTDLRGPFVFSREAAKIMTRKRAGRIINISSIVGQMGNPGQANYSAAKAGLIGLTKACAKELGSRGITVNAIAPGFIRTEMTDALDEKTQEAYIEQIPLKRFGTVEDVAEAAAFLASEKASYISGQVIAVNGGLYC